MADDVVVGSEKLTALFERMLSLFGGQAQTDLILFTAKRIGVTAEQFAQDYPPSPDGRPRDKAYTLNGKQSKWKTTKQQRWFFANLKGGKLRLPYRRTGTLGKSITSLVEASGEDVVIRVGTNLVYAPKVIGLPTEQARYHIKTGWQSLPVQIASNVPMLVAEGEKAAMWFLEGYIKASL